MTLEDIIELHLNQRGMIGALGIDVRVEDGKPVCRMTVDDRNIGAPDVAHGGSLMALLDTALGAEAMAHSLARGCGTSTVELKVNFLRRARRGVRLETESRIDHAGRSLLVVSGTARDVETGEAVALALGTFNVFSLGRSLGETGPDGSGTRE
jgi:uncharacterized protein (TIGR00369 family)